MLDQGKSVVVLLERPFSENAFYEEWYRKKSVPSKFLNLFKDAKVAAYTELELNFLDSLISMKIEGHDLRISGVDMSFRNDCINELESESKYIRSLSDEDEFDLKREKFIVERMIEVDSILTASDHVLWFAGNMHTSKTSHYFSLREKPEEHISTSGMYLSKLYESVSIFCYPISGSFSYQSMGAIQTNIFNHHSDSYLRRIMKLDKIKLEDRLFISNERSLDAKFYNSYDLSLIHI